MKGFCIWGGRPGTVWIGSATDRAHQRRQARTPPAARQRPESRATRPLWARYALRLAQPPR